MTRGEFFLKLESAGYRTLADFCRDYKLQYNKTNNYMHGRTDYSEAAEAFREIGIDTNEFPL